MFKIKYYVIFFLLLAMFFAVYSCNNTAYIRSYSDRWFITPTRDVGFNCCSYGNHQNYGGGRPSLDSIKDISIRSEVQNQLLSYYILRQYEDTYIKDDIERIDSKKLYKINKKTNYSRQDMYPMQFRTYNDILNYFPYYGYRLPINYERIDLKYNIPIGEHYDSIIFYKVSVDKYFTTPTYRECNGINHKFIDTLCYWQKEITNDYLKDKVEIPREIYNVRPICYGSPKGEYHRLASDIPFRFDDLLIACRGNWYWNDRAHYEFLFLSKEFLSFHKSKELLYYRFVQDLLPKENVKEIKIDTSMYGIDTTFVMSFPAYKGNPKDLIPFIYIMSYSDYEPEDVFFEKRRGFTFFYTFYSLKYKKKVRVKFNTRTINFENYKFID